MGGKERKEVDLSYRIWIVDFGRTTAWWLQVLEYHSWFHFGPNARIILQLGQLPLNPLSGCAMGIPTLIHSGLSRAGWQNREH